MTFVEQLNNIISSDNFLSSNNRESQIQEFFEKNPELLILGHKYISPNVVFSKLPINNWVTDFAYINPTSGFHYLILIEIEDPSKKIFNKNDEFTQQFNHALQQVHDWLRFCCKHDDYLRQFYNDAYDRFHNEGHFGCDDPCPLMVRGKLIYGSRSELQNNPVRKERWQQKKESESPHVEIITYDGLLEQNKYLFREKSRVFGAPGCARYQRRSFDIITQPVR